MASRLAKEHVLELIPIAPDIRGGDLAGSGTATGYPPMTERLFHDPTTTDGA
jgi:hypothetical protein